MIEDQLELTKGKYIKSSLSSEDVDQSWSNLEPRLGAQQHFYLPKSRSKILVVAIILITFASVQTIQAAKPGQILYPAKLLTDDVIAEISGKLDYKVNRRGQEIIDLSEDNSPNLEEAQIQYQQTLEEVKKDAQKSGRQEQFDEILEQQQQQFEKAIEKNPSAQSHLEEAIQKTEKAKGQVKGDQDSTPANENNQNRGNSDNRPQKPQENR